MNNQLFQGIFPIKWAQVPAELLAGITLAAIAIPSAMGYTQIAGTPLITGLYTLLIPMTLYAVFGSSRHLVVAADSATAAILASSLVGVAVTGSHEYMAFAGLLALMSGVLLIGARIIGLGFLADFLSRTVLIGFLTGVGVQIAISQIAGMMGVSGEGLGSIGKICNDLKEFGQINPYDLGISLMAIGVMVGAKRISRKIPGALIVLIGAIVLTVVFNLKAYGVRTLGTIPSGLPSINLPDVRWSLELIQKLIPAAFSMFIVILAQSAATSRAYAARHDEHFDENVDLLALGLANIGAGLSGSFVVNGSPTNTQIVDSTGSRSQLSHVMASLVVLLVLLFFTGTLTYIPKVVLSTIVFLIGLKLVDIQGMSRIWKQRRAEFWVALTTTMVVVFVGVEQGIVIAMVLSLIEHVRRSYRSKNVVLTKDKVTGSWLLLPVTAAQQVLPGLLLYRFAHTIYYANAQQLYDQVIGLAQTAQPNLKWFCIDASAVADVDFTAAETLREIFNVLKSRDIRLVWTNVTGPVLLEFDTYEITGLIGKEAFYPNIADAITAYQKSL